MDAKVSAVVFVLALSGLVNAQDRGSQGLIKETGQRVALMNGNDLYARCATAEKVISLGSGDEISFSGSRSDAIEAASCWFYIEGVVDSIPAGGDFSPGPGVRLSQYVDVVTAYLKNHANTRDRGAYRLVQDALREAFPHP